MATVKKYHVMTLGTQQSKTMTTLVQSNSTATSCVVVNPQNHNNSQKTVLINLKRPIAPSESRSTVLINNLSSATANNNNSDMLRCKRRINFTSHNNHLAYAGLPGHQPASVARRNARERNRVKQVNNGFATLRSHIPLSVAAALSSPTPPPTSSSSSSRSSTASKKLSKVDTLRMAVEYIRSLKQLLEEQETDSASTSSATETTHNDYYSSSPEGSTVTMLTTVPAQYTHHMIQQSNPLASLSPPCSEASSSPTPSYASEGSGSAVSSYATTNVYQQENYENYEPMSPEDEELLDVISWWQQSQ